MTPKWCHDRDTGFGGWHEARGNGHAGNLTVILKYDLRMGDGNEKIGFRAKGRKT